MNPFEQPPITPENPPAAVAPEPVAPADGLPPTETPPEPIAPVVDPVRAAAGRLGGQRVHKLAELGREYERQHGLSPGRQRLKQLIQLGRRYEIEHGLRAPPARRPKAGDAWADFVAALARVVQPRHRPAVERLALALRTGPIGIAAGTQPDEAA